MFSTLERTQFAVSEVIEQRDLLRDGADYITRVVEDANGRLRFILERDVWRAGPLEIKRFKYPSDWREAFKERWFPAWAKEKWPVKYKNVSVQIHGYYPEFRCESLGKHVIIPETAECISSCSDSQPSVMVKQEVNNQVIEHVKFLLSRILDSYGPGFREFSEEERDAWFELASVVNQYNEGYYA